MLFRSAQNVNVDYGLSKLWCVLTIFYMCYNKLSDSYILPQSQLFVTEY